MMNTNLKKMITAALFTALACVATMSIRIPTPGTNGYIHPGDCNSLWCDARPGMGAACRRHRFCNG